MHCTLVFLSFLVLTRVSKRLCSHPHLRGEGDWPRVTQWAKVKLQCDVTLRCSVSCGDLCLRSSWM